MKKVATLFFALSLLLGALPVSATTPAFGITSISNSPTLSEVRPGERIALPFSLQNQDPKADIVARLTPSLFGGDPSFLPVPLSWISLPQQSSDYNVKPMTNEPIEMIVSVPDDAKEGIYRVLLTATLIDYSGRDVSRSGSGVNILAATETSAVFKVNPAAPSSGDSPSGESHSSLVWYVLLGLAVLVVIFFAFKRLYKE